MPIYEYQCTSCGKRLELLRKISDPPETTCPDCNTDTLQKLVSAAGFRLKGTGWYVTDFRDKDKKDNKPGAKSAGNGSSTATSESKAESKESTSTPSDSKTESSASAAASSSSASTSSGSSD